VKGSSSVSAGRAAAFEALQSVQAGALLDAAFRTATRGLEGRERSWARECAFGVLRHRGRLDRILDSHLHKGLKSVEAPVLELLRLGAYQILRMDGVPAYAAVSQTVEQVRGLAGGRPTGLVNGVLRAVAASSSAPAWTDWSASNAAARPAETELEPRGRGAGVYRSQPG